MSTQATGTLLVTGVRPYGEGDPVDILVIDGVITEIGTGLEAPAEAERVDGGGGIVLPGFVDLHTHLREPGREDTETIRSGSAAAALGGYTAVFAMANTSPVADNSTVTDNVWRAGREVGLVDVYPVGAVTVGLEGTQLAEMGMMAAGAAAVRMFSDDGKCVHDPLLMRRALEYAKGLDVLIAQHAEEPRLTVGAPFIHPGIDVFLRKQPLCRAGDHAEVDRSKGLSGHVEHRRRHIPDIIAEPRERRSVGTIPERHRSQNDVVIDPEA